MNEANYIKDLNTGNIATSSNVANIHTVNNSPYGSDMPSDTESKHSSAKVSTNIKKKAIRKFKHSWTHSFPWLLYLPDLNVLKCRLCEQENRSNQFATNGSKNFKTSAFIDHEKSKDHQNCLPKSDNSNDLKFKSYEQKKSSEKNIQNSTTDIPIQPHILHPSPLNNDRNNPSIANTQNDKSYPIIMNDLVISESANNKDTNKLNYPSQIPNPRSQNIPNFTYFGKYSYTTDQNPPTSNFEGKKIYLNPINSSDPSLSNNLNRFHNSELPSNFSKAPFVNIPKFSLVQGDFTLMSKNLLEKLPKVSREFGNFVSTFCLLVYFINLNSKHFAFLSTEFLDCVKDSFKYFLFNNDTFESDIKRCSIFSPLIVLKISKNFLEIAETVKLLSIKFEASYTNKERNDTSLGVLGLFSESKRIPSMLKYDEFHSRNLEIFENVPSLKYQVSGPYISSGHDEYPSNLSSMNLTHKKFQKIETIHKIFSNLLDQLHEFHFLAFLLYVSDIINLINPILPSINFVEMSPSYILKFPATTKSKTTIERNGSEDIYNLKSQDNCRNDYEQNNSFEDFQSAKNRKKLKYSNNIDGDSTILRHENLVYSNSDNKEINSPFYKDQTYDYFNNDSHNVSASSSESNTFHFVQSNQGQNSHKPSSDVSEFRPFLQKLGNINIYHNSEASYESRQQYPYRLNSLVDKIHSFYVNNYLNLNINQRVCSSISDNRSKIDGDWIYQMDQSVYVDKVAISGFYLNKFLNSISNTKVSIDSENSHTNNIFQFNSFYISGYDPHSSKSKLVTTLSKVSKEIVSDLKLRLSYSEINTIDKLNQLWDVEKFPSYFGTLNKYNTQTIEYLCRRLNLFDTKKHDINEIEKEWNIFKCFVFHTTYCKREPEVCCCGFIIDQNNITSNNDLLHTRENKLRLELLAEICQNTEYNIKKKISGNGRNDGVVINSQDLPKKLSVDRLFFALIFAQNMNIFGDIAIENTLTNEHSFERGYEGCPPNYSKILSNKNYLAYNHSIGNMKSKRSLDYDSIDCSSNANLEYEPHFHIQNAYLDYEKNTKKDSLFQFPNLQKLICLWYLLPLSKIEILENFRGQVAPIIISVIKDFYFFLLNSKEMEYFSEISEFDDRDVFFSGSLDLLSRPLFSPLESSTSLPNKNSHISETKYSSSSYQNVSTSLEKHQKDSKFTTPRISSNCSDCRETYEDGLNDSGSEKNCAICGLEDELSDSNLLEILKFCKLNGDLCPNHAKKFGIKTFYEDYFSLDPSDTFTSLLSYGIEINPSNLSYLVKCYKRVIFEMIKSNELDVFLLKFGMEGYNLDIIESNESSKIAIKKFVLDLVSHIVQEYTIFLLELRS
ncbi:hypothetical protein AYI69_g2405 [Smittium culicis]|uniref:TTF-type domain-containing protein n=1 Tax=Smittium culicis TaxID=133412 RepID=A0A1R1YGB8_9FUNG|nr:hypothetical protein AYI69_g4112 [Smittium culicis]OMJ28131.1 hypothetical protein AYI69_g2405 [Smittium culicis]